MGSVLFVPSKSRKAPGGRVGFLIKSWVAQQYHQLTALEAVQPRGLQRRLSSRPA